MATEPTLLQRAIAVLIQPSLKPLIDELASTKQQLAQVSASLAKAQELVAMIEAAAAMPLPSDPPPTDPAPADSVTVTDVPDVTP